MSPRTAGLLLGELLSEPGRARRKWVARTDGSRAERISWMAVAKVLAEHLWETGDAPDTDVNLPRRLRDLVRRALLGEVLTRTTLIRLMDAFELNADDHERLEDEFDRPEDPDAISGIADSDGLPVRQRYRTVSISERHYVGADRCPTRHLTTQVLKGTGEPYPSHLYMFDTNTIAVVGKQGIREVGPIRQIAEGVFGVDIMLLRALKEGETSSITYESHFTYDNPPEPEFRRAAFEGVASLDLRVEFDERALPSEVAFAEWDQLGHHEPARAQVMDLEEDFSVQRFLESVDTTIVGFRRTWA